MNQIWLSISLIFILISSLEYLHFEYPIVGEEICDNAIDDDNDGLIDLNDPDCKCEVVSLESLIPNPSFEDYRCCPNSDSQLYCAIGWNQASSGTTDYVNTCGYLAVGEGLLPFPDGEGALLFLTGTVDNVSGPEIYEEFAGACLNRTMQKDSVYKIKFHLGFLNQINSPEIRFAFFGSPSCANLPFSVYADCPTNYPDWYFLKAEIVSSGSDLPLWVEVSTVIKPSMDINALVFGGDCSIDSEGKLKGYFVDNIHLNDQSNFDFELIDQRSPCDSKFTFTVVDNDAYWYQWYKEGIALIGEDGSELSKMYGEGSYQLRLVSKSTLQCRIADEFEYVIPFYKTEVYGTICAGGTLLYEGDVIEEAGVYEYSFTTAEGCDSTVMLYVEMETNKTDTVYARKFPDAVYNLGNVHFTEEGEHHISLITTNGCDSTVVLYLKNINVYFPNVFSPNGDNINDYFEVLTSADEFVAMEISIYNRWGNLLYSGVKWDGTFNQKVVDAGVYVYSVKLIDITGKELSYTNTVTLIK